jgi:hypothetical protein
VARVTEAPQIEPVFLQPPIAARDLVATHSRISRERLERRDTGIYAGRTDEAVR